MRSRILFLLFAAVLFASGLTSAYTITSYSAEYDLDDSALVSIHVSLENEDYFSLRMPSDSEQVQASTDFSTEKMDGYVLFESLEPAKELDLSYSTKSVFERSQGNFFILDLSKIKASSKTVLLKLPEEAKLKYALGSGKPSIFPETKDVITDGRRIIIRWTEPDFFQSRAILVMYDMPFQSSQLIVPLAIAGLVILLVAGILFAKYWKTGKKPAPMPINEQTVTKPTHRTEDTKHEPKQDHSHFTRNLFEEEKLIVEILLSEKLHELWQKQLEQKTGFNKVRLSRKLRHLEAKGLIEKIPYGNTNKIRLKKD